MLGFEFLDEALLYIATKTLINKMQKCTYNNAG